MKQKLGKYNSFTLVELLLVTIIIGIVMPIIVEIYIYFIKSNKEIVARETTIQQWYEFFERLNILMQDYTIDYEEYYNRQMVWCVTWAGFGTWNNFKWNIWVSGHCTEFTAYWNENSTNKNIEVSSHKIPWKYHNIYYCSSNRDFDQSSCSLIKKDNCWTFWNRQSFGQYRALFFDIGEGRCEPWDPGYTDLWTVFNSGVNAIVDGDNIQELYLISHDWKNRLYFRRSLVDQTPSYAQYRIQMLRLRWFDAWEDHNYDSPHSKWLYDGQIDTWACDASMWFNWNWGSIWWAYSEYRLPLDENDCWIDLTYGNTSIYSRNISISPLWNPELFWTEQNRQINPYMKIFVVNWVYLPEYASGNSVGSSIMEFKVPIQTTINMKSFYRE